MEQEGVRPGSEGNDPIAASEEDCEGEEELKHVLISSDEMTMKTNTEMEIWC